MKNSKSRLHLVTLFLISALINFATAAKSESGVRQQESMEFYKVTLHAEQSLREAMRQSSPITKEGKLRFGQTIWSVSPGYLVRNLSGSCYISKADVQLDIKFILPELAVNANTTESLENKFSFFYDALLVHEQGHKALGVKAANEIQQLLSEIQIFDSCQALRRTMNEKIQEIINHYMQLNREYDRETDFGRTQGAVVK